MQGTEHFMSRLTAQFGQSANYSCVQSIISL
jgi:hypothetical protein